LAFSKRCTPRLDKKDWQLSTGEWQLFFETFLSLFASKYVLKVLDIREKKDRFFPRFFARCRETRWDPFSFAPYRAFPVLWFLSDFLNEMKGVNLRLVCEG